MSDRWTVAQFKAGPEGTRQLGLALWWNRSRIGFQINYGRREMQIMKERS